MPALTRYSSITVAVNTPVQLTLPSGGHWSIFILNSIAAGHLYVSDQNNPGANATSALIPANVWTPGIVTTDPVWIASDTAGTVTVYCRPQTPWES